MLRAGVVKRSKERAEEPCNVLRQGREEGPPPPSLQAERIANGQIALLFHPEIDSNLSIVANQAGLGIEIKGAHVEIERSDEDDLVVDTDVFSMQQPLAVKIDRDPGAQKFFIIGSLRQAYEPGIASMRKNDPDFDAAHRGCFQSLEKRFIRNEIWGRQSDTAPCAMNQGNH